MTRQISLRDHVERVVALDEASRRLLESLDPVRSLGRRQELKERVPVAVYVVSGLLRLRFVDRTGNDRTFDFALEGWWIADWASFFLGKPPLLTLETVEESQVVVLPLEAYLRIVSEPGPLGVYFRTVFQRIAAAGQYRRYLTSVSSGEEMYENFVQQYPEFLQRVPQYMLASFLGFTPEFLSKIRKKRAR